jgi:hypothetical protein
MDWTPIAMIKIPLIGRLLSLGKNLKTRISAAAAKAMIVEIANSISL